MSLVELTPQPIFMPLPSLSTRIFPIPMPVSPFSGWASRMSSECDEPVLSAISSLLKAFLRVKFEAVFGRRRKWNVMQLEILAPKLAQDLFCLLNYPPNLLRNCGLGVSSSGRSQDDQQDAGEVGAGTLKGELKFSSFESPRTKNASWIDQSRPFTHPSRFHSPCKLVKMM